MKNGKKVERDFGSSGRYGYPWMLVLDGARSRRDEPKVIATSIGPDGNIGCPVNEKETDLFFGMLRDTRKRLTDEDLKVLRAEHEAFAKPIREMMKR